MKKLILTIIVCFSLLFLYSGTANAGYGWGDKFRTKAYSQGWLLPYVGRGMNPIQCSLRNPTQQEIQDLYVLCEGQGYSDLNVCHTAMDDQIDILVSDFNCAKKNLVEGTLPNGNKVAFNVGYNMDKVLRESLSSQSIGQGWLVKCADGSYSASVAPKDRFIREMHNQSCYTGVIDVSYCDQAIKKLVDESINHHCPIPKPSITVTETSRPTPSDLRPKKPNIFKQVIDQLNAKRQFSLLELIAIGASVAAVSLFSYYKIVQKSKKKYKK